MVATIFSRLPSSIKFMLLSTAADNSSGKKDSPQTSRERASRTSSGVCHSTWRGKQQDPKVHPHRHSQVPDKKEQRIPPIQCRPK
eukprot:550552-Amphidinium_carterae.1